MYKIGVTEAAIIYTKIGCFQWKVYLITASYSSLF